MQCVTSTKGRFKTLDYSLKLLLKILRDFYELEKDLSRICDQFKYSCWGNEETIFMVSSLVETRVKIYHFGYTFAEVTGEHGVHDITSGH